MIWLINYLYYLIMLGIFVVMGDLTLLAIRKARRYKKSHK